MRLVQVALIPEQFVCYSKLEEWGEIGRTFTSVRREGEDASGKINSNCTGEDKKKREKNYQQTRLEK